MARPDGIAPPARRLMSVYSVVKELITKELITKDPWRDKRQGRDEPRAQESGARVYGSPAECRRKRHIRVKRESLNPLYRKEKRAFVI
jgi:hypothetical protein